MVIRRVLPSLLILGPLVACATSDSSGSDATPTDPPAQASVPPPGATPTSTTPSLPPPPTPCDDAAPPQTDAKNCGRCGHDCLGGQCAAGECRPYAVATGLPDAPIAVALDKTLVYWVTNVGTVLSCPLAGCLTPTVVIASTPGSLTSIAVDDTYVYYTSFGTPAAGYADGSVARAEKSGANPTPLATLQHKAGGVVADGTNVYWAEMNDPGAVNQCARGGCALTPTPVAAGQALPSAPSVDGTTVFWNDQTTGEIWKRDASGSTPFLVGRGAVLSTAVDATSLYFAQFDAAGKIVRASKDGTSVVELATSQSYPESVAIDDTRVYWTTPTSVWSADKSTGKNPKLVLSSGATSIPKSLRVDDTSVVWCENGGNRILRVAK